ncbi:MAG: rhodanese-like domain-containing protein [Flavobacteriales bacterium]|nr:rhodanese-like domain-containing protein [Flavobacteriales bacterium]
MFRPILLIFVLIHLYQHSWTQSVGSPLFGAMLNTLIHNKEMAIDVDEAAQMSHALFFFFFDSTEYAVSHLPGAVRIGYTDYNPGIMNKIPLDMPIVVYCSVGRRSEDICEKLRKSGFNNAQNMYGGIFEWINRSLPVHDMSDRVVTRVHTYNKSWGVWVNCPDKIH